MVQVIQNPVYSGGTVDPAGQSIGQAMNSIAAAFATKPDVAGQIAVQNYKDKLAAQQVVSGLAGKYADAQQDALQDAPDYAPGTQPAPPTIDMNDPAGVAHAFMVMGMDPGKAIQNASVLSGGIRSPGVAAGATMDDKYASTPEGITNANDLAIGKEASAPVLFHDAGGNVYYAPKNAPPPGYQPVISNDEVTAGERQRNIAGAMPGQFQTPLLAQPQPATPANPANPISVPGYDGTFTRPQANDSDGVPSQSEWDAAAKPASANAPSTANIPMSPDTRSDLGLDKADKQIVPREIGRDEMGQPIYGTVDSNGVATPLKIQGQAQAGASVSAQVASLPGVEAVANDKTPDLVLPPDQQARLGQVPQQLQGTVASILQGRTTMPKLTGRMSPMTAMLTKYVFDVNPQFDAANNQAQVMTRKAYAPGGNNNAPGTLIQNGDAALDHLAELKDASDKLANYGSVAGPALGMVAGVTGGAIGHDYSAARAELDTKAQIASAEAIKYLAGATGGGEGERNTLMQQFSSANPPDSRLAAIQGLAQDILQKKQEAPDFEVISPNQSAAFRS